MRIGSLGIPLDVAIASRWRFGMKAKSPGELVRIDHMTVSRDG